MTVRKRKKNSRRFLGRLLRGLGRLIILAFFAIGLVALLGKWVFTPKQEVDPVAQQREAFFQQLAPLSQEIAQQTGLKASVGLAQAALESDFGTSTLASDYNNYFGIKAGPNEPQILLTTKEFENGQWIEIKAPFRVYDTPKDCLWAHVRLLQQGTTWNPSQYQSVFWAQTVEEQVKALGQSGYATDPSYTEKLKEMIDQYQLKRFDQVKEKDGKNEK